MKFDASNPKDVKKFLALFKKKQVHSVVSVHVTESGRFGSDTNAIKKYHGKPYNVLRFIASAHSYEIDDADDGKPPKILDILTSLIDNNGDGCDFIYGIEFDNNHLDLGQSVTVEDETSFDCDDEYK